MTTLKLDLIQTVALSAVVLFLGYGIRRRVGILDRFNIPAPVVGGFLVAFAAVPLRQYGLVAIEFDTALQTPFMIAFFTAIGLGAGFGLLRTGGAQLVVFWILASVFAAVQSGVGMGLARLIGVDPLIGLISGSITMTGGHGTGAAFGRLIEDQYRLPGALTLAVAAATFGLVAGGLLGAPLATLLVRRRRLAPPPDVLGGDMARAAAGLQHAALDSEIDTEPAGAPATAHGLLRTLTVILLCMWSGGLLSEWLGQHITLPAYIGAMLVAVAVRNLADATRIFRIEQRVVDDLGTIALSLFLSMALMASRLWELLDLALPMLIILSAQVAMMALFAYFVTFVVMGRDYDAAVMAGGHCGFGLGATPTAVANMTSLVERFGPAPRAFLVVPMVGAFFIDFTNALIITTYLNLRG